MNDIYNLPQEVEEGNIEYKRQVDGLTDEKIIKFKTQMIWRMSEGKRKNGIEEATYYIGIEDNGSISDVNIESINNSILNFTNIANLCNAEICSTQIQYTLKGVIAIIKIRKLGNYLIDEIKIGLLGSSNNGKTTFLGNVTYDILDDGDGSSRSNILRYDHEKQNGITSSIKYEIIGCNDTKYINYNSGFIGSWEYIVKNSKKIINFIDLPGNYKFIKTTLFGLTAHRPDYILIFIDISRAYDCKMDTVIFDDETNLHIELCMKLSIPFALIFTKKDMMLDIPIPNIIDKFQIIFNSNTNFDSLYIKSESDLNMITINLIPIIVISNVTGENINLVKLLLKNININKNNVKINKRETEFMINDVIFLPDVGTVVTGILNQGRIKISNKLLIGPINKIFCNTEIISIHKKQIPCKYLYQGEIGSLVIKSNNKMEINKHMMIFDPDQLSHFTNKFKIIIKKENHISKISKDLELKIDLSLMVMCRNIYDSITILNNIKTENENIIDVMFHNDNIHFLKNGEYIIIRYNNNIIIGNVLCIN